MDDWKAKQAAKASAAAALQAANPHLLPIASVKGGALIAASKNALIELKRAFPGVKFSARTSRYSGGDSMTVRWTDGPTSKQVDEIVDRYQGCDFDGMTDSTSYRQNVWIAAFGDANYVFANREYSDAMIASCARLAINKWGLKFEGLGLDSLEAVVAAYRNGALRMRAENTGNWDFGDLIYQELARRTYSLNKAPASVPMNEQVEA